MLVAKLTLSQEKNRMYRIIRIKHHLVFSVLKIFNLSIRSRLVFFTSHPLSFSGGYIDFWSLSYDVVAVNIKKEAGPISMTFTIPMYNASKLQVSFLFSNTTALLVPTCVISSCCGDFNRGITFGALGCMRIVV